MKKKEGMLNGEAVLEEGDWENDITSPETEISDASKLRFPNPAKYENDFSAIYPLESEFKPQLNFIKRRHTEQPKRKLHSQSLRCSSLDQSTVSCYNELSRSYKSNCDFHFSSQSETNSPHESQNTPSQILCVNNTTRQKARPVNVNSYSTDV